MKKTLFLLFLACQLSLILSQTVPAQPANQTSPACNYTNPLINYIKSKGVTFVKYAKYLNIPSCNYEWNLYGSCCNTPQLTTMVKNHLSQVDLMLKKAAIKFSKFQLYSSRLTTITRVVLQRTKFKIANSTTIAKVQKTELQDELRRINSKYLPYIDDLFKSLNESKAANLKNQDYCVKLIASMRSSSVCYACSGRAPIFFTKGNLNLHENDCRGVISECSEAWLNLLQFTNIATSLKESVVELGKLLNINLMNYLASDASSAFDNLSSQRNLVGQLTGCYGGDCSLQTAQKICKPMISFKQPYYIERILNITGNSTEELEVIANQEAQPIFQQSVIDQFEKESFDLLVAKILEIRKQRLLQEYLASQGGTVITNSVDPIVVTAPLAQDNQQISSNLMGCQKSDICDADKVVLTTSQCSLSTIMCTSPSYTFP